MKSIAFLSGLVACLAVAGCSSSGGTTSTGGTPGSGGSTSATGGTPGTGGSAVSTGGTTSTGGSTATGGTTSTGGVTGRGGSAGSVGAGGRGGSAGSGVGGHGTGGSAGHAGASGTGGTTGTGGSTPDGGLTVDCTAMFPSGGQVHTGSNVNGTADGLNYGIWTNGSGGSITVFPDMHAFSASWNNSMDFLAHLGLDFNATKAYTAYGTIQAQFSEIKSGSAGGFSSIGMYGWMHSPCIEWYINEDSFNGLGARGNVTATIDGGTYYLTTTTTTGTGGANACESGHTGGWTQIISTRKGARTCGIITVSDHFAAWEKQGWTLGTLASVHINVEVGGGIGSIEFPVANVTTTSK